METDSQQVQDYAPEFYQQIAIEPMPITRHLTANEVNLSLAQYGRSYWH